MPEFMTKEMREQIGSNVLWPKHTAKINGYLDRSETACDDTHKFNPSRFDARTTGSATAAQRPSYGGYSTSSDPESSYLPESH